MEVTVVGAIIALISVVIVLYFPKYSLQFVFVSSLMGAASVINFPALGDTSVPPGYFVLSALGLSFFRLRLTKADVIYGLRANSAFVLFAIISAFGAFFLPRLFEGAFEVVPMAIKGDYTILYTIPLAPSVRNISQSVYIVGTALAAVMATMFARRAGESADGLTKFILCIGMLTALLGFIDLIGYAFGVERIFDVVRNGNYGQTSQAEDGFRRVAATFSEASGYAAYAMTFFVFSTECWLREINPKFSGLTAAALALILLLSTSSSAYAGLAIYSVILLMRVIFLPKSIGPRISALLGAGIVCTISLITVLDFVPSFSTSLLDLIASMTIGKGETVSGVQRGFWSQQAYQAFVSSFGLGAGVGSLRSSSYVLAVLGSTGVIGSGLMLNYFCKILPLFRWSSYSVLQTGSQSYGVAAGWAALVGLGPALVSGASADPGLVFGLFAGLSLYWSGARVSAAAKTAGGPNRRVYVRSALHPRPKGGLYG